MMAEGCESGSNQDDDHSAEINWDPLQQSNDLFKSLDHRAPTFASTAIAPTAPIP